MLFHDMGKPAMKTTDEKGNDHFKGHALESEKIARTVLKRLKFDNETIRIVTKLVCYHDYRMEATPANVRRAMNYSHTISQCVFQMQNHRALT